MRCFVIAVAIPLKMNKHLIVVVGPTAIGKTALSIRLAQAFDTEIISADSRQFYAEMRIGTAVPEPEELKAAPHHCIQHRSIFEPYSVGDFEREALALLATGFTKHDALVMVGGSGLYVNAVCEGLDDFPTVDPGLRDQLNQRYQTEGLDVLVAALKEKDPHYYEEVDRSNPQRVIRALEVCISSGQPFSSFRKKEKPIRPFSIHKIGLQAPREILYDRINQRVDLMVDSGLVEEARTLFEGLPKGSSPEQFNALNTVGYKELFAHFRGTVSLSEAIANIKMNTRRFAKRQLTWYRKDASIHWFPYDCDFSVIYAYLKQKTS